MFKHFKLLVSISILAIATSVFVYSQGRTTIDGLNPQLPAALGTNGGLKTECWNGAAFGNCTSVTVSGTPNSNITQFGSNNVATGVGAAGVGIPRVTTSNDNIESTGTVNANGLTFQVALAGQTGVGFYLTGACTCTITYEWSWDNGTTWSTAIVIIGGVQTLAGTNNPATAVDGSAIVGEHWTHFRARVTAWASGTPVMWVHATKLISPLAVGALAAGAPGSAVPFFANTNGLKAQTGVPTAVTNNTLVNTNGDVYGVQFVRSDHPNRVRCNLTTANTTSTLVTGCGAVASNSYYITDISVYGGVAVGAAAAATIQYGTGGACGTGTTILSYCQHAATDGCEQHFLTPLKTAANNEVCILDATVGTKFITISGHLAP